MSEKKPSSLRNALREMRVNEPLRLSKSGPSFKPPPEASSANGKEVPPREAPPSEAHRTEVPQKAEPRNEPPQNEAVQKEEVQYEVAPSEPPRHEPTQSKPPRNEDAHNGHTQVEQPQSEVPHLRQAQNEAPRSEIPRNEPASSEAPRKKQAKNEPPRNEATTETEVAQIELPQIEQSSKAFFRLSDRAFSFPQLQRLSGDCFRLFLWMSSRGWRFQTSDGTLRASVGFIEDHTAMSHATISRCLKTLREASLLELLETDYKRGNVWCISPIAFAGCDPENLPPRSEQPQNGGPRREAAAPSKRDRSHLNLRTKPPRNEGQIRSIKKPKNLSQEGTEALLDRIEKIRAPEKQKTERDGLMQLLETHTCEEISTTLAYVDRYGTLSGESCHSPFRYLATAIDDVLQTCRKKGFTPVAEADGHRSRNEAKSQPDERQEEERKRTALAAFQSELTAEERTKVISDFVAKEFSFGYKPSEGLATRLAAMHWFTGRQSVQAAQAS